MVTEYIGKFKIMSNTAEEDGLVIACSIPNRSLSNESHNFEGVECKICIMRSIEITLREFQNHVGKRHFECILNKVISPNGEAKTS